MNEQRLRRMLREAAVPGAEEAERRGQRVVAGAFAQRRPARRTSPPRLALALAIATLLLALVLSPAGASVRDWIDDVLTVGVRDAEPALTDVPGGGRLLVTSPQGPWVVQADGSRRLLGEYEEATWSPRGLFVGAVAGNALSAIEPDGTLRWSLSAAAPVADPRWSPSGVRIAYRAGGSLRAVVGNGSGDRLIARRAAAVPPEWWPPGAHLLAYLRADGGLRIVDADSGQVLGGSAAPPRTRQLAWSPDGTLLLQRTPGGLWVRETRVGKVIQRVGVGPPRRLSAPSRARFVDAAFSPQGDAVAALRTLPAGDGAAIRSELVLYGTADTADRVLFRAPGRLYDLAWSPDGRRLLIGWPEADQWLFVPIGGAPVRAVGDVSAAFDPGTGADLRSFPRIEGWCCPANVDGRP